MLSKERILIRIPTQGGIPVFWLVMYLTAGYQTPDIKDVSFCLHLC